MAAESAAPAPGLPSPHGLVGAGAPIPGFGAWAQRNRAGGYAARSPAPWAGRRGRRMSAAPAISAEASSAAPRSTWITASPGVERMIHPISACADPAL